MGGVHRTPSVVAMPRYAADPSRASLRVPLAVTAVLAILSALTYAPRASLYTRISDAVHGSAADDVVALLADKGLLLLIATAGVLAVTTWLRHRAGFLRLAAGGLGAIVAHAISEAVKSIVAQPRPCHVLDVATALTCPAADDWSWPSNHATIAGSIAVACLLVAPRLWPLLVPLAAAVAAARVGAGVHYVHDVAAGLALGTLVTSLVSTYATPALARVPSVRRTLLTAPPRPRA